MTEERLEYANKLNRSLETIIELRRSCTGYPYPEMHGNVKVKKSGKWFKITDSGFCYKYTGSKNYELSFASLDAVTREQLKSAINEVLDRRYSEIHNELESI